MLSSKEKIAYQQTFKRSAQLCHEYGCGVKLTRANESSGLDMANGKPIGVPLCQDCANARDYRAGC